MNDIIGFYQQLGWPVFSWVLSVFILAGLVKGVIGLGLPTVAMGLLGLAMAPVQAAALLIVPSMLTNAWQLAAGGHLRGLLVRLWPLLLAVFIGTLGAGLFLGVSGEPWVKRALGGVLVVYALAGLFLPALAIAPRHEGWLGFVCGLATGCITALTGVFVIPAVPYLQALGLQRDELVQALGLSFTVSTLALGLSLYGQAALGGAELGASLVVLAPALAGMWLGQWLRRRINALLFKRAFFVGILLLGLHLSITHP